MKRLFTFGCSYTKYFWPTWADFLGLEFDHSENWGHPGIGNRGIAERIAECDARNRFTKDDVVIVQWSSYLRHDWYHVHDQPKGRNPGWKTFGSIFSAYNEDVFDDRWLQMFFFESAYVMHTLNNIRLTQRLLEASGCTWYMTSIGDIRNLGRDLDESQKYGEKVSNQTPPKTNDNEEFPIWVENDGLKFYEESIWNEHKDKWLTPLHTFLRDRPEYIWWFKDEEDKSWRDSHPSSTVHAMWLKKELGKRLSLAEQTLSNIDNITASIEEIKSRGNLYSDLCDSLGPNKEDVKFDHPKNFIWPPAHYGF